MDELLHTLGLWEHQDKFPSQLSGGQQQRCAIARALIKNPKLLYWMNRPAHWTPILHGCFSTMLTELNERLSATILMVTHDAFSASYCRRILFIKDGEVFHQLYRGNMTNEELYVRISDTLTVLTTGKEGGYHA